MPWCSGQLSEKKNGKHVIFLVISLEMSTRFCIDGIDFFSASGMLCTVRSKSDDDFVCDRNVPGVPKVYTTF